MKLLIDLSSIFPKKLFTSVSACMLRLVDTMNEENIKEVVLLVDESLKPYMRVQYPNFEIHSIKRNYFLYRLPFFHECYGKYKYKQAISKIDCDFELITSDLDRSTKIKPLHKRVVMIHDLKGLKEGSLIQKKRNYSFYKNILNSAIHIIAISLFTKNDIIKYFNTSPSKITVVYNSVKAPNSLIKPEKFRNTNKYILYVNTLLPYKNIITLIKAFNSIKEKISHDLVIIGRRTLYWNSEILPYIRTMNLSQRIILLENLSDQELHYMYKNASLFITTSTREGFGLTPIEAAIHKIPVISSKCEALPESTQGLVNYYEPADDFNNLAKKIIESFDQPAKSNLLSSIAEKLLDLYSPKRQLKSILNIFQGLNN